MAIKTKDELKQYFEKGDRPTQVQFGHLIDTLTTPTEGGWGGILNAKDYAVGSSTGGVQEAINLLPGNGGIVLLPAGNHVISASIVPRVNTMLLGTSFSAGYPAIPAARIQAAPGFNSPLIDTSSDIRYAHIQGIGFQGNNASGSKGVHAVTAYDWTIKDCFFNNFGDQAIHIESGAGGTFEHIFVQGSLLVRTGRTAYVGCVDIGCSDAYLWHVTSTASVSAIGDGYIAGIVLRGTAGFMTNCVGHISEVGIVIPLGTKYCRLLGTRADLNYGPGYIVGGNVNEFIGNLALRNSQEADNAYSGFVVTNGYNTFALNRIASISTDAKKHKNGFDDSASVGAGSEAGNSYYGNRATFINGVLYNITGTSEHGTAGLVGRDFIIGQGGLTIGGKTVFGTGAFAADVPAAYTAADKGLVIVGKAGTTHDLMITEGGGQILLANPQGTLNIQLVPTATGKAAIGTASPNAWAKLDIAGTDGALLVPRMTTAQRDALTATNGMIIYNTTTNQMEGYINGAWAAM